ncbi:MAG TPA: SGNH/GDSL hydrolase family protein, partial [Candidatus Acidoferrum sp.]|nr:SGNH/GDSL hydrolase family protein [Candidatus Acidoferrum sp.]
LVLNGGFEKGLTAWNASGAVHLETNSPLEGKASAILGPGPGSLSQRVEIGSGNDFTLSAMVQSAHTNGYVFAIRFLDKNGREVMRADSLDDIQRDKKDPRKFTHFMQAHPLTKWMEIVFSKDASPGSITVDQVKLEMMDENAADLKPTCNLDEVMQPFWLGKRINKEAVLMLSTNGEPASGQLMFQPTRIISVQNYGLATNYSEGTDYALDGRTLVCAASSRMTRVRSEDLLKGEYQWNVVGGKQVMVTYEHDDSWTHPIPAFLGDGLPHTLGKLQKHVPLTVVAYGDSITHGLGGSRLSHVRPYLPPWPELFVHRLKEIYRDRKIQFFNSAQSGADSKWAAKYAEPMVASLNPDLVIVAFGQNDFWSIPADTFSNNIASVIKTVRRQNPSAEFLLVSTMRFDPAYTTNAQYWNVVGDYAARLKALTGPGVQFVDMTAISEWVYAAKKPKDCVNDPLHPNDYLARWYAQSLVAALDTSERSSAPNGSAERATFDAAPDGIPLAEGNGLMWEDPREIHSVIVDFAEPVSAKSKPRLEYWGSHWPQEHLPKDQELGNGWSGWMELGNWYNGGWRMADAVQSNSGQSVQFAFRPINEREFPNLTNYASTGRFTLKIRVTADQALPKILRIRALTDSTLADRGVRIAWEHAPGKADVQTEAFNGHILSAATKGRISTLQVRTAVNSDPNTFDRTLVTVRNGTNTFTFKVDDLSAGALFLPEFGAAVLPASDKRDFSAVAADVRRAGQRTLYDRIADLPEQTWTSAWNGMPPKKTRISFIIGMDGSRQKFCVDRDGLLSFRRNDHFMEVLPARDTPRLALEKGPVKFAFGLPDKPVERHIEDESIPTCITTWERDGIRIVQTAFATALQGAKADAPPASDATAVAMLRFDFTNTTETPLTASLPITITDDETRTPVQITAEGLLLNDNQLRGQIVADPLPAAATNQLSWSAPLAAHATKSIIIKVPYLRLVETWETEALKSLNFEQEQKNTGDYWRRVLDKSARLITPEPVLNNFYRAAAGHFLINAEMDPGSNRRFARVSSFNYGVYGNESCMMVLDMDRRGYHQEAADCLETWIHYQGTVGLPGDFDSMQGILYGADGYEAGGYNQHHGWILWTLVEHYRFTRDEAWLHHAAPAIIAGADWIIRETVGTSNRVDAAEGLLPPGDLEDIGDWWNWLSTSCYTWRGLDSAAWALEQIHSPDAARIRAAADRYHQKLLEHFLAASTRSPVVRLRDGTAVPQFPSYVQRRGRSFGWICETLEGAMHLIITRAIDPKSIQAQWILKDYEDNLFLSPQYGYTVDDFDKYWFGRGGMSMQACLLLDPEAYLYRDDIKQALRAVFNAIALNHFPDVHMNTEHALPEMGDWAGDQYKTSDEGNACGWLRELFVREEGDTLLIGQAVPRGWLMPGKRCGIKNTATYFGNVSVIYEGAQGSVTARLQGPTRNPPQTIRLRFRVPGERPLRDVTVNGKPWRELDGDWVALPGNFGTATITATY